MFAKKKIAKHEKVKMGILLYIAPVSLMSQRASLVSETDLFMAY